MAGAWRIGDALTLSRDLADDSVDCIVTSPPYWGLRSYLADDDPAKAQEMGAEPTLSEYVDRLVTLFRELRRALKPDGTCWLNLGDCYQGDGKQLRLAPYRVALALQADGWYLRSHIIWAKPNPMPESVTDRPTSAHEAVFLLTKSARYWYDADAVREPHETLTNPKYRSQARIPVRPPSERPTNSSSGAVGVGGYHVGFSEGGRNKRNVWSIPSAPYSGSHYAVMPPKLIEPCIKAGCPPKVCVECGAPWVRVVERTAMVVRPGQKDTRSQNRTATSGTMLKPPTSKTTGWRATCDHDAGTRPGLVLDPFGGSGTVGMVAESLGRDWLMFDLDERNEALMAQRTAQRSLLGLMG